MTEGSIPNKAEQGPGLSTGKDGAEICHTSDLQLQSRIMLPEGVSAGIVGSPSCTVLVEGGGIRSRDGVLQVGDPLKEVDAQAARDVPSDMAVHEPGAGVIRLECDDDPALPRQHRHVPPHRVVAVKLGHVGSGVEGLKTYGIRVGLS